jgi:hypothetical protein
MNKKVNYRDGIRTRARGFSARVTIWSTHIDTVTPYDEYIKSDLIPARYYYFLPKVRNMENIFFPLTQKWKVNFRS